uniref:Uncharacterized protein n=1 Tax=Rhizophora mucronata TaxID=61149 RepID=A0A2P2N709_RHIMU
MLFLRAMVAWFHGSNHVYTV